MAYNRPYYQATPPQAPAYPSHPPPAAAYASYAAPPPLAAPVPAQNPAEAFRHFFRSHLATLTFNSRPVINHLTQLALDQTANFANAVVVSEEIAKGIFEVRAPPPSPAPLFFPPSLTPRRSRRARRTSDARATLLFCRREDRWPCASGLPL